MSPTIPPVLVLSLLLVPPLPTAEAGEVMDLFALIRRTLKYWRRIYQMYEEEVTLGYCWAEYFLHPEEDTNKPMSTSVSMDPTIFIPAEGFETYVTKNAFNNEMWKDWVASMNNVGEHYRNKRSSGILNSEKKDEILKTSKEDSDVYSKIVKNLESNKSDDSIGEIKSSTSIRSREFRMILEKNSDVYSESNKVGNLASYMKFPKNKQENLDISTNNGGEYRCSKQSSGILNAEGNGKISETSKKGFDVYSKIVKKVKLKNENSVKVSGVWNSTKTDEEIWEILRKNFDLYLKSYNVSDLVRYVRFHKGKQEDSNISKSNGKKYRRSKRSDEILNFVPEESIFEIFKGYSDVKKFVTRFQENVRKKLIIPTDDVRKYRKHPNEILNTMKEGRILESSNKTMTKTEESKDSIKEFVLLESYGSDKNRSAYKISNSIRHIIENILKALEKIGSKKTSAWKSSAKEPSISNMFLKADKVEFERNKGNSDTESSRDIDSVKYGTFPRNLQENRLPRHSRRSSGTLNSTNEYVEEISKILENGFSGELATSDISLKTGKIKVKSNKLTSNSNSEDINCTKHRTEDTYSKGMQKDYFIPIGKSFFETSDSIKSDTGEIPNVSSRNIVAYYNDQRLFDQKLYYDMYSKVTEVKLPSNERKIPVGFDSTSISHRCRKGLPFPVVDDVTGSPFLVPSSLTEKQRVNQVSRLFPWKREEIAAIDGEDDLGGKSKNLQVDTCRKLLYSKTNRVTSGTQSRLKPAERQGSRSSSVRKMTSLNSRSKDSGTSEELEDNGKPSDFLRRRKFGSTNLKFQRVEQRPGSFRGNYRRNLRRKRDTNDRIRSHPVRPLSKSEQVSSYNPTSLDETPRFSSKYVAPAYGVWTKGIETRLISSKNDDETFKRDIERLHAYGTPTYYLKQHQDILQKNQKPILRASSMALDGIQGVPSQLMATNSQRFRTFSNHVLLKQLSEDGYRKWEKNWSEGSSSKQLPIGNDNRYRRTKHTFLVEKPVVEQTGKKPAIRYPIGRPSLLPVSYPRFMGDYGSSTSGTARNSSSSRSSRARDQGRQSSTVKVEARGLRGKHGALFYLRQAFMGFLRTFGFFVNVGRQLMDYVDSNSALACTKDYLVGKAIRWIDS